MLIVGRVNRRLEKVSRALRDQRVIVAAQPGKRAERDMRAGGIACSNTIEIFTDCHCTSFCFGTCWSARSRFVSLAKSTKVSNRESEREGFLPAPALAC